MQGPETSIKQEDYPNLESRLFELSISKNPAEYAATYGLYYAEGLVRVVIELKSQDESLPAKYSIQVESHYENIVQALVPIKELRRLSNEPQVKYVRTPLEPWPDKK